MKELNIFINVRSIFIIGKRKLMAICLLLFLFSFFGFVNFYFSEYYENMFTISEVYVCVFRNDDN